MHKVWGLSTEKHNPGEHDSILLLMSAGAPACMHPTIDYLVWSKHMHGQALLVHTLREAWMSLSWKSSTRIFSLRSAVSSSVSGAGSAFMPSFTLVAYSLKRRSRSEVAFVDCAASAGAAMAPSWPAPCEAALVRQPCQRALSVSTTLAHTSCLAAAQPSLPAF